MKYIITILLIILFGCAGNYYDTYQPERIRFHEIVYLDHVIIHYVSSRDQIPYHTPKPVDGLYDVGTGEIYVLAEMVDGKIVMWSYWIGGHELQHAVQYKNPLKFGNPDADPRTR